MERRNFIKSTATIATVAATGSVLSASTPASSSDKSLYELKIYQLSNRGAKNALKSYLTEALLPLLNQFDIKFGAFEEYGKDEPPKIYTLLAFPSTKTYFELQNELNTNKKYLSAADSYFKLPATSPVYERYETFLTEAFDRLPHIKIPGKSRGLFELRTYESYNEEAAKRKIAMFNDEEISLFEELELNPVFFGKILAGRHMPALMYMVWFDNMEQRETKWTKFANSPEWKTMSTKPIYANTVSKVNRTFLIPTDYSQI